MDNKLSQFMFEGIGVSKFKKYMDLASLQHRLVSSNIANTSTPGYQAKNMDFQKEFDRATSQGSHLEGMVTHKHHLTLGDHKDRAPKITQEKIDGETINSVDIDKEISTLAQNELIYTVGARLLQKKFDGLRKVITSK